MKGEMNMEDEKIVALYFARNESAIAETDRKYGAYLFTIAERILSCVPDSEECVNDTYMRTWQTVPPERPSILKHFLAKITRNLSLDRYKMNHAEKRGGGEGDIVLSELAECIPAGETVENALSEKHLREVLCLFLEALPMRERCVFLRRYFYLESASVIAKKYAMREHNVHVILSRTRGKLKIMLEKEGIFR